MKNLFISKCQPSQICFNKLLILLFLILSFTTKNYAQENVLEQVLKEYGKYQISADACGTVNSGGCNITINKPVGASVFKVYVYAGANFNFDPVLPGSLAGITLNLPSKATSGGGFYTTRYGDVTSSFTSLLNSAAPGFINLLSLENNTISIDGVGIIVVWQNPTLTTNNGVSVSLGNIQTNLGLTVNLETAPIDKSNPAFKACLGLGIGFSFYPNDPAQISTVLINVNQKVLTTQAGGYDDGIAENGGLITLGGEGDSKSLATEDELYDLAPCIQTGETAITVSTASSRDDEYLQAMYFQAEAVESPSCNISASSEAGTITCNGGTTSVTVSATGGTPPYDGTGTFTVGAGPYSYTVTDSKGCTSTTSGTITQPAILSASSTAGTITCNGGTTTVNVSASGGTAPYSGTGAFTVGAGTYSFTVTDVNGCQSTTTGNITQPAAAVGGIIAPAQKSGCGPTTVNLSVSGITGTVKQWERRANCTGNWVSIGFAGMTAITVTTPNQTSCYRANVTNATCPTSAFSTVSTITVDKPAVGGTVTSLSNQNATSAALCPSQNVILIPKNHVGLVTKWQYSFGTSPIWYDLPGTENQQSLTVNGSTVTSTIFYRAIICSALKICTGLSAVAYSNAFRITKKGGCTSPDGSIIPSDITTDKGFTVMKTYPNPATNLVALEIESYTEGVTQLEILDVTGRQVLKQTPYLTDGFNTINLDISQLTNGVFIVKLTDSQNQKAWVKMVKE